MKVDAHRYNISVRKTEVDGDLMFEATVRELPDVATYGESFGEAYEAAIGVIEDLAAEAAQAHKTFPEPSSRESASGRVTLRLPKSLHALASQKSVAEGMSLNSFLTSLISYGLGGGYALSRGQTYSPSDLLRPADVQGAMVVFDRRRSATTMGGTRDVPRTGEFVAGMVDIGSAIYGSIRPAVQSGVATPVLKKSTRAVGERKRHGGD